MKLYKINQNSPIDNLPVTSATIGNFDGLHIGHQALIRACKELSKESQTKTAVLSFDPHPEEFFSQIVRPPIFSFEQKRRGLAELDVSIFIERKFDDSFAKLSADEFQRNVLKDQLNATHLAVGYDFRYGKGRVGDPGSLARSQLFDKVISVPAVNFESDIPVSSSAVRHEIEHVGPSVNLSKMLGRPWLLEGEVVKGQQLGRTLKFPTLNLGSIQQMLPAVGVYAGWLCVEESCVSSTRLPAPERLIPAAINVGFRPTVEPKDRQVTVEAHAISTSLGELYGRRIAIYFVDSVRKEKKFTSVDELKVQIGKDLQSVIRRLDLSGRAGFNS